MRGESAVFLLWAGLCAAIMAGTALTGYASTTWTESAVYQESGTAEDLSAGSVIRISRDGSDASAIHIME